VKSDSSTATARQQRLHASLYPTFRAMLGGEAAEDSGQVTQGNSRETRSGRTSSETISLSVSPEFARKEQSCASKRRYPEDVPGPDEDPRAGSGGLREGKPWIIHTNVDWKHLSNLRVTEFQSLLSEYTESCALQFNDHGGNGGKCRRRRNHGRNRV